MSEQSDVPLDGQMSETDPGDRPFCVFIGGFDQKSGAKLIQRDLEAVIPADRLLVVTPISQRNALTADEFSLSKHYDNKVRQSVEGSKGGTLRYITHSQGGYEALPMLEKTLAMPDFKDRTIEIVLFSVPGAVEKPLLALASRFIKAARASAVLEQHVAYPAPESFYDRWGTDGLSEEQKKEFSHIVPFGEEEREKQRIDFMRKLEIAYPDGAQRKRIQQVLTTLDAQLLRWPESREEILKERAKLVGKVIQQYGKNVVKTGDIAQDIRYRASQQDIQNGLFYWVNFLSKGFYDINLHSLDGFLSRFHRIVQQAAKQNVTIKVAFAFEENGPMMGIDQLPQLQTLYSRYGAEVVGAILYEAVTHFSAGHLKDFFNPLVETTFSSPSSYPAGQGGEV